MEINTKDTQPQDTRPPWELQPEEPELAFTGFRFFRDLGPARTVEAAYKSFLQEVKFPEGTVPTTWAQFSKWPEQFRWQPRVRAWALEQDRVRREQHLGRVVEEVEAQRSAGRIIMNQGAAQVIQRLKDASNELVDRKNLLDQGAKAKDLPPLVSQLSVKDALLCYQKGAQLLKAAQEQLNVAEADYTLRVKEHKESYEELEPNEPKVLN